MQQKYTLVLSGWWAISFYSLWVLKRLEEVWITEEFNDIWWVSAWAFIWALFAWWLSIDEIFEELLQANISISSMIKIFNKTLTPKISKEKFLSILKKKVPSKFSKLSKKLHVGCVDSFTWEYHIFNSWDLHKIVLASMSIPILLEPVFYKDMRLVDGWLINNFPIDLAYKQNPNNKFIWVNILTLDKTLNLDKIKDDIMNTIRISIVWQNKFKEIPTQSIIFSPDDVQVSTLSTDKDERRRLFDLWYSDCKKQFPE